MKHLFAALLVACLAAAIAHADEEDDMIMGNYQGAFTDGDWANKYIRAQVVAQSKTAHKMVLFIGNTEQTAVRLETQGRSKEGIASFKDTLSLPDLGGDFIFTARIENQTLAGALKFQDEPNAKSIAFELKRIFLQPPTLGMAPPEGAVILFDGTNLAQWQRWPLEWCLIGDNAMEVCGSSLKTIEEYGSGLYHVEFQTPFLPTERGQGRGNSGVYVLGRYEVQVLDSFGLEPADNFCGGIYSIAVPLADAILPPKQWQTYDIAFTAPEFNADGEKTRNARITVAHNGITIHDDLELPSPTPGGVSDREAALGPMLLQDHGNQVRYRNIWFKPAN